MTRTLYFSTLELYEKCPQRFLWTRGQRGIDVGGGPGNPKPLPFRESEHDKLMGGALSRVIEDLYNKELWRSPKTLVMAMEDSARLAFRKELVTRYLSHRSPPHEDLLSTIIQGAKGYVETMKRNRLLGPYARSEVDIVTKISPEDPFQIGGRPDILIRREDTGVMILDGKNSKTPGKYVDVDQLRWYALCYLKAYEEKPSRIAFCYFRYPPSNPPEGFDPTTWTGLIDGTLDEGCFDNLAVRARKTVEALEAHLFDPTPSPKNCKFCPYESVCDARIAQKAARSNGRPRKKLSVLSDYGFDELGG